jgi:hypothetical protein
MALEFDAANRADAERRARHAGMAEPIHCALVRDPSVEPIERVRPSHAAPPPRSAGTGRLIAVAVALVLLTAVVVLIWPRISALMGR